MTENKFKSGGGRINDMIKKNECSKCILDFFFLYKEIYTELKHYEGNDSILLKLKNLECSLEQIESIIILNTPKQKKISDKKIRNNGISEVIKKITDLDSLRTYYYQNINEYFDSESDDEKRKKIINSLSSNDLRHLYSIVSNISLPSSKKKVEIISLLRVFFENESRTNSLRI